MHLYPHEWVPLGGIGLTFSATALYPLGMRVLGLLVILGLGFGFGIAPVPANAEPCPFHLHTVAIVDELSDPQAAIPTATTGDKPVLIVAFEFPGSMSPLSAPDHAVPEGDFCCHVAVAVASVVGLPVEPHRGMVSRSSLPSGLPPWAAPLSDIYRPPTLS